MATITDPDLDQLDTPTDAPGAVQEPAGAPGSALEGLRRRRRQIATEDTPSKFLDVPDYKGALVVEYRYPEAGSEAVLDAVQRAQTAKERDALLNAQIDVLVRCCHAIYGIKPGAARVPLDDSSRVDELRETLESLDPDPTKPPLRFSPRLAELLQIQVPEEVKSPARFVCRQVFSPRAEATGVFDGDLALMTQTGQLITWLTKADEEVGQKFVGE